MHADEDAGQLSDLFEELRLKSLADLDWFGVDEKTLTRKGRHPAFGTVALSQLLSTWVVHDLSHCRQIFRSMAKRYREAIGPWREYLRVMDE